MTPTIGRFQSSSRHSRVGSSTGCGSARWPIQSSVGLGRDGDGYANRSRPDHRAERGPGRPDAGEPLAVDRRARVQHGTDETGDLAGDHASETGERFDADDQHDARQARDRAEELAAAERLVPGDSTKIEPCEKVRTSPASPR